MAKFHVNPKTGNPSACRASKGGCPFGSADEHFTSQEGAREYYENTMKESLLPGKKISREQAVELNDELIALAEKAGKEIREQYGKDEPEYEYPFDREALRERMKRNLLDTIEDRTGEKLDEGAYVTVYNEDGTKRVPLPVHAIGDDLPVGEYKGYHVNPETRAAEEVTVAVYDDSTASAFKQDLRDNLEYRHARALEKDQAMKEAADAFEKNAPKQPTEELRQEYAEAAERMASLRANTDFTNLDSVTSTLDAMDVREEELWEEAHDAEERGESEEVINSWNKLRDDWAEVSGKDAYEIVGRQKLAPLKKK